VTRRQRTTLRRARTFARRATVIGALTLAGGVAAAQDSTASAADSGRAPRDAAHGGCDGERVSAIDIERQPPPVIQNHGGFTRLALKVALQHATTREWVVRDLLQIKVGDICSNHLMEEAARVLRTAPFIAGASVAAVADSGGRVRIAVQTVDEVPPILGASIGFDGLRSLLVGNSNVGGGGMLLAGSYERGGDYRNGFGVRFDHYHLFSSPTVLDISATRRPLGDAVSMGLGRAFLTDLQPAAWHTGYSHVFDYQGFLRPDGVSVTFPVSRTLYHLGGVARIYVDRASVLIGGVLSRESANPHPDQELVNGQPGEGPPDTAFARYHGYNNTRASVLLGFRQLNYIQVASFDAMSGEQNVPRGLQLVTFLGKSVPWFNDGDRDYFFSVDGYGAVGNARSLLLGRFQGEIRRDLTSDQWDGLVVTGRLLWHLRQSPTRTFQLTGELSSLWRERLPAQLGFADTRGGLRGFRGSDLIGGHRLVARAEERWLRGHVTSHAAWGFSAFVDAGVLAAGDIPYGVDSGVRSSFGGSLLVAIPPESKRLYTMEVAVPVRRDQGSAVQLRFYTAIPARAFWNEPGDAHRVRAGVPTGGIFSWP
jgi:hypothetical protein